MTVTATDPGALAVNSEITITVTDVDTEAPGKMDPPSLAPNTGNGHEELKVTWTAPENAGPAIMGYVAQYRIDDSGDEWTQVTAVVNTTETTISGFDSGTTHEAQVRAKTLREMGRGQSQAREKLWPHHQLTHPLSSMKTRYRHCRLARTRCQVLLLGTDCCVGFRQSGRTHLLTAGAVSAQFSTGVSTGQINIGPRACPVLKLATRSSATL